MPFVYGSILATVMGVDAAWLFLFSLVPFRSHLSLRRHLLSLIYRSSRLDSESEDLTSQRRSCRGVGIHFGLDIRKRYQLDQREKLDADADTPRLSRVCRHASSCTFCQCPFWSFCPRGH